MSSPVCHLSSTRCRSDIESGVIKVIFLWWGRHGWSTNLGGLKDTINFHFNWMNNHGWHDARHKRSFISPLKLLNSQGICWESTLVVLLVVPSKRMPLCPVISPQKQLQQKIAWFTTWMISQSGPLCFLCDFCLTALIVCGSRFQTRIDGSCIHIITHLCISTAEDMILKRIEATELTSSSNLIHIPFLVFYTRQFFCKCLVSMQPSLTIVTVFLLPQTPWIPRGQDVFGELRHLQSRTAVEVKQFVNLDFLKAANPEVISISKKWKLPLHPEHCHHGYIVHIGFMCIHFYA